MTEPPPPVTSVTDPRQRVNAPAIALLIMAIVGGIFSIAGLLLNVLGVGLGALGGGGDEMIGTLMSGSLGMASSVIGLLLAGFIGFAAMKMKNLESWGMAVAASILAMIPCISPCCLLGLPIGIWSCVVLFDDTVKSSFR